ncbi:MAG: amidohydrolase family protein, partial [Cyclobacteriaceae bacterium]
GQNSLVEKKVKFTTNEGTWISLDVSLNDKTIAFELVGDVYTIPMEGGKAILLLGGSAFHSQPRYSQDGRHIIYVSDSSGSDQLWVMDSDGQHPRQVSSIAADIMLSPAWSVDDQSVFVTVIRGAFNRSATLFQIDINTGKETNLLENTNGDPSRLISAPAAGPYMSSVRKTDGQLLYSSVTPRAYGVRQGAKSVAMNFDPVSGKTSIIPLEKSNSMKPSFSHDGKWLVYAAESEGITGLRAQDMSTGREQWLAFPFQRNELEARASRDVVPNYSITHDSKHVIIAYQGKIHKINLQTLEDEIIPFSADIQKSVLSPLRFPQRIDDSPFIARFIQQPALSHDGKVVVSVHTHLYQTTIRKNHPQIITATDTHRAFYPSWSIDGKALSYATWDEEGGHIWIQQGKSEATQVTKVDGFYAEPVIHQNNKKILALRSSIGVKRATEYNVIPTQSDFVEVEILSGNFEALAPSDGFRHPQYNLNGVGFFATSPQQGLVFFNKGKKRKTLARLTQPVKDLKVNATATSLLALTMNGILFQFDLPENLLDIDSTLQLSLTEDARLLTNERPEEFGWSSDGKTPFWTLGNVLYHGTMEDRISIDIKFNKAKPSGTIVLAGAKVITMNGNDIIENADIVIKDNRILEVGTHGSLAIPKGSQTIDASGKVIIPGIIDVHAHFGHAQDVLEPISPFTHANLAYGTTTIRDPQSSPQIFNYAELIEAGEADGPRVYSTGPGIFAFDQLDSYEKVIALLKIYATRYRTHLVKSYLVGTRQQRQWVVQACKELGLMPTTEGGADTKQNITHAMDGFSGNEHAIPTAPLYKDILQLFAQSGIAYTPTLLVAFGGPLPIYRYMAEQNPFENKKLKYYFPNDELYQKSALRLLYFRKEDHHVEAVAESSNAILQQGGLVSLGGHGEMQGLQNHWEMWLLASGGMSNYDVLKVATLNSAKAIGLEQDLGSIEKGKLADLIILDKDPLQEIHNTTSIHMVMKNGVLYEASTLDKVWPEKKPAKTPWWRLQN